LVPVSFLVEKIRQVIMVGSLIFSTRKDTVVVLCLANPEYMRRKPLVLFVKNIYKIKIKEDL